MIKFIILDNHIGDITDKVNSIQIYLHVSLYLLEAE